MIRIKRRGGINGREESCGERNRLPLFGFYTSENPSCADFIVGTMLPAPAVDLRGESLYYSRLT